MGFTVWLRSGVVLCKLANAIQANAVSKIHTKDLALMQHENITNFVRFARSIGVPESSVFSSDDLYDAKNMVSVINCIHAFGGQVQVSCKSFTGPKLGVPMNAKIKDKKRSSGLATDQSVGFSESMDLARPSEGLDASGIVRSVKLSSPRPAASAVFGSSIQSAPAATPATAAAAPVAAESAERLSGTAVDAVIYGMDKDQKEKMENEYPHTLEKEAVGWIEALTGERKGQMSVCEWLRSGVLLCNLVNVITPGNIPKVHRSNVAALQHENIKFFLSAARDFGVREHSAFNAVDLYEEKNMGSVICCLHAFGGAVQVSCPNFNGPKFGVAVNAKTQDRRRSSGLITDAFGGFSTTMEVERPSARLDKIVRSIAGA